MRSRIFFATECFCELAVDCWALAERKTGTANSQRPTANDGGLMRNLSLALLFIAATSFAQQADDAEYTRQIRQFPPGPQFTTEMVDHLPASSKVPTPLKFLGYIAGAENHLTYAEDVYRYMRALEAASPRVKVFSIGKTEEGRACSD